MRRITILFTMVLIVSVAFSQNTGNTYIVKQKSLDGNYYLELIPGNYIDSIAKKSHGPSYDERDLFLAYPYNKKIEILRELLKFQGDNDKSSKSYKIKTPDLRKIQVEPFTIQIEALYTFSRMLLLAFPDIQPKLTDKKNKRNYNGCQKKIDEVYSIYNAWLEDAISKDFKDIELPMSGTKYQWEGQEKISSKWFIDFHYKRNDNDI